MALCFAGSALAQEAQENKEAESRLLFRKGLAHYHLQEYQQAIEALKEGYRLSPAPGFLFNIAQAYRMKRDCQEAHRFYEEDARLEPEAGYHAEVVERIGEMKRCMDERRVRQRALASENGTAGRGKRIVGIVSASLGIALLGAGIYYGLDARSKADQVSTLTRSDGVWNPALDADGASSANKAILLFSVGGAAVLTGSVLYYLGWRNAHQAPRLSAEITSRTVGVRWHCAF